MDYVQERIIPQQITPATDDTSSSWQKGYRMVLNNYGAVVMQRRKESMEPIKYIRLSSDKKTFAQQLAAVPCLLQ